MSAHWQLLTDFLGSAGDEVTLSWSELDTIVGGLPQSATRHFPQWWRGDRSHTRAWEAAGFEATRISPGESVTFIRQSSPPDPPRPTERMDGDDPPASAEPAIQTLRFVDRDHCLIVIPCSARKRADGRPGVASEADGDLAAARRVVLADESSRADETRLLPAWERYDGNLYRAARPVLPDLASQGRLVILSGGYGLLDGRDPIGNYNRIMRRSDWPDGLLERLLAERTQESGRDVVAFASSTTDYAKVIRETPWRLASGRSAVLVTVRGLRGATAVSSALGKALLAFATGSDSYPAGTAVETLAP